MKDAVLDRQTKDAMYETSDFYPCSRRKLTLVCVWPRIFLRHPKVFHHQLTLLLLLPQSCQLYCPPNVIRTIAIRILSVKYKTDQDFWLKLALGDQRRSLSLSLTVCMSSYMCCVFNWNRSLTFGRRCCCGFTHHLIIIISGKKMMSFIVHWNISLPTHSRNELCFPSRKYEIRVDAEKKEIHRNCRISKRMKPRQDTKRMFCQFSLQWNSQLLIYFVFLRS